MKTITCRELGGVCDDKLVAKSYEEMKKIFMSHVEKKHPEVAENIKMMQPEESEKWNETFVEKWEAAS